MSTKTYYAGPIEAPYQVEAMQYAEDGSTCVAIHEWMGWWQEGDSAHASEEGKLRCGKKPLSYYGGEVDPGQWIIKHPDGRVTAQDHEPVWVHRMERSLHDLVADPNGRGLVPRCHRAALSNGVMLPWEPIDMEEA